MSFCLSFIPDRGTEISDIEIKSLGNQRTRRYGSVGVIQSFVLAMAFIENIGVDCVQFRACNIRHVRDDYIEDEAEMFDCFFTTIDIMKGSDAEKVIDTWFELVEKFGSFFKSNCWHLKTIVTDFFYK